MTLQIEFWQLVTGVASTIVAFALVVWAFGTILVKQFKSQLDHRFAAIQLELTQHAAEEMEAARQFRQEEMEMAKQLRQFERDFAKFQIEMPLQYVRREDYIRGQTVIESKLDALYSKLELVQIQGAKHD